MLSPDIYREQLSISSERTVIRSVNFLNSFCWCDVIQRKLFEDKTPTKA
jgi:hypothetical protein